MTGRRKKIIPAETLSQMQADYDSGLTMEEVAEKYHVSRGYLTGKLVTRARGRLGLTPEKVEAIQRDRKCGMTLRDIAKKYHCSRDTVSKILYPERRKPESEIIRLPKQKPVPIEDLMADWDRTVAELKALEHKAEPENTPMDSFWAERGKSFSAQHADPIR